MTTRYKSGMTPAHGDTRLGTLRERALTASVSESGVRSARRIMPYLSKQEQE